MDCAEFREIVHELAKEEIRAENKALDATVTVPARFHAQICDACTARLNEVRALASALKIAAEDSAKMEAPAHVEKALTDAFREHHWKRELALHRRRHSQLRWAEWVAVAAAASVAFAAGAWRFSHLHPRGRAGSQTHSIASGANTGAEPAQNSQEAASRDSDFVPVPYGESFTSDDSGVVVRVSMTRSALATLGYPVDDERPEDVVQADLIVGDDGWPRAVRLVQ